MMLTRRDSFLSIFPYPTSFSPPRLLLLPYSLILANDLLPTACESITRNITYNDVQAIPYDTLPDGVTPNDGLVARGKMRRKFKRGGVVVNQGDAK